MIEFFIDKDYKVKIHEEQKPYDTSMKAFLLGYESFYIGSYLKYMRYAEWFEKNNYNIFYKIIGG